MNNLQSLRSQLLYEYSEQESNLWRIKNFYQHHNLPARTMVKTSQGNNNLRMTMQPISFKRQEPLPSMQLTQTMGRTLFGDAEKRSSLPGPGAYDSPLKRHSSHCYIKKQQSFVENKIAKRLRKRKLINQCRGPGIYNPERAFQTTSKSKSPLQGKISQGSLTRLMMPNTKMENLYLASSGSQKYLHNANLPEPNRYNQNGKNNQGVSNYSRLQTYKISNTQRSSMIKEDGLPGPGFYNWQKFFDRKKVEDKVKGKIRYKFVYGHPS